MRGTPKHTDWGEVRRLFMGEIPDRLLLRRKEITVINQVPTCVLGSTLLLSLLLLVTPSLDSDNDLENPCE